MIFKRNLKGIALLISEIKSVKKKGLVTAVTSLFYLDTARPPLKARLEKVKKEMPTKVQTPGQLSNLIRGIRTLKV